MIRYRAGTSFRDLTRSRDYDYIFLKLFIGYILDNLILRKNVIFTHDAIYCILFYISYFWNVENITLLHSEIRCIMLIVINDNNYSRALCVHCRTGHVNHMIYVQHDAQTKQSDTGNVIIIMSHCEFEYLMKIYRCNY